MLFEAAYNDLKTTALTENEQLYTTAIAASALGDYERALEPVAFTCGDLKKKTY